MTFRFWITGFYLIFLILPAAASAAGPSNSEMIARYRRAAEIQAPRFHNWLLNQSVVPHWIRGRDEFWFERQVVDGHRFVRVNAVSGNKSDAFNHSRLAEELGRRVGRVLNQNKLPLKGLRVSAPGEVISFSAFGKAWRFDDERGLSEDAHPLTNFAISPDGRLGIFTRADDLWMREFGSGTEVRLTNDGEPHYRYGANPEARPRPGSAPGVVWSSDSRHIFTVQTDDREVLNAPVVEYAPAGASRPRVINYRMAFPGDLQIPTFRLTLIDVRSGRHTPVKYMPLPAVRMNNSPVDRRMWWNSDASKAYFVDIRRGEKSVNLVAVDAKSGITRTLFSEQSDTYVELGSDVYSPVMIRHLPKTNRLIWYSERSGWAHLYLYDLSSGKLVRPLTRGNWVVRKILAVNEDKGQLFISIAGRVTGRNPYYEEVARVDIATGDMSILSSGDEEHYLVDPDNLNDGATIGYIYEGGDVSGLRGVSPSGNYFVETMVTADKPSSTVLRDHNGRFITTVEAADARQLPSWWRWPEPVEVVAADGVTKIYGLVFRPSDYNPAKKYAVIDYVYGGPQAAYVPTSFGQGAFGQEFLDAASIAELGFVTVMIDGRGTAQRSRAFHETSYGHAERASNLDDHIAGIQQLAQLDPGLDTTRVGITGFSAGGYLAANAMFRYPEFYKVGVAMSGSHDLRLFWSTWGERYQGYPVGKEYDIQANTTYVKNLKGKLLLVHGLMDTAVTPAHMFQLEQALISANKDFDTLVWPRAGHFVPSYGKRRQWDYFVEHLANEPPPREFQLRTDGDIERDLDEMAPATPAATAPIQDLSEGKVSSRANSPSAVCGTAAPCHRANQR